jgi:TonB-linked SusC/RagA family outer membrane protein
MKQTFYFLGKAVLFFFISAIPMGLLAQNTVSGEIKDKDGEPVIGAAVIKQGSTVGTITDVYGKYTFEYSEPEITLLFQYIGFTSQEHLITPSTATFNVVLNESATNLDELVVTGLATSVKRSNLANSIETVSSKQLTAISNQTTLQGALYGKVKGANISANSGSPGAGISIRLRGITAVLGTKQPLYILDGVFLNNFTTPFGNDIVSAAAGAGNQASTQDDATNRIADLDPYDLANIEVIKGSSAGAIYGSKAANGVVILTSKRGLAGKPKFHAEQIIGWQQANRLLGQRNWDATKIEDSYGPESAARFDAGQNFDYEKELFGNKGLLSTTRFTASGGNSKTTYFTGVTGIYQDGIVENTGYKKVSLRLNLDHQLAKWVKFSFSNNFISSTRDAGFFNNGNNNFTVGYALAFTDPTQDLHADANGNYPIGSAGSNVLETVDKTTNQEKVNRFISSIGLDFLLLQRENHIVKLKVTGGMDYYGLNTTSIFPREMTVFQPGQGLESIGGASIAGDVRNNNFNVNGFIVWTAYTKNNIAFRTQAGVAQESVDYDMVRVVANDLNGSQVNVQQAGVQSAQQTIREYVDEGFFVQEEVNFQDKVIATVGIRGDRSTRNGDIKEIFYYPKVNAAVNFHKFDFWGVDATLSTLKVRAAYGEAGTFAPFGSKYTNLNSIAMDGGSSLVTPILRGNPEIGPQRNKEFEFGFDLGFIRNRITLDFTYYFRTTEDFLLAADVPQSTGFIRQIVNAGDLQNQGFELGIYGVAIDHDKFQWRTGLGIWKNTSEVTKLNVQQTTIGGFANSLGTYLIQEGESITQIVGSYIAEECDGCDPDGDGLAVYGNSEPDFTLTWTNVFTIGNFDVSFLLNGKKGGDVINLSTLLYDLAGNTWDYDDTDLDPEGLVTNSDYRVGNFGQGSPVGFVEDGWYVKLREIGVFYRIPSGGNKSLSHFKVGVSARNALMLFNYNSYDPEVSNFGSQVLGTSIEVTPYPSTKQFNFHLVVDF